MKRPESNVSNDRMAALLDELVPHEAVVNSAVEGVRLFRIEHSFSNVPNVFDPRIVILAQGQKFVLLGGETYQYDPHHYLVLSVPMPVECAANATPELPVLGFSIRVEPAQIGEILLGMEESGEDSDELPKGICAAPLSKPMTDASVRLLEALASSNDGRILGPMIVREIMYRVLRGTHGETLRALAYRNRRFFQMARVLNKIHKSYEAGLDVRSLASEAGMSVSTFHANFKAVTNASPLQYIKGVRLHNARNLMTREGLNAQLAAQRVGYESASQFNREYKRYFGVTPGKDLLAAHVSSLGPNTHMHKTG